VGQATRHTCPSLIGIPGQSEIGLVGGHFVRSLIRMIDTEIRFKRIAWCVRIKLR
jgi:hypothetical protein